MSSGVSDFPASTERSQLRAVRFWLVTVLPAYFVLALVHTALGWQMRLPRIYADELGYLGHARYLSGAGTFPDMGTTAYYHFGYSLWAVPAFWLFPDPVQTYKAVVITNGFLISLLFVALYYILHSGLGTPRRLSVAAAFVTSLYPAFMLQSNLAWAESALIPAYATLIAAFVWFIRRPSVWPAACVGVLSAYLYTIHPRALPVLPLVALALMLLSARRVTPWLPTWVGIGCIALTFLATDLANDHLRSVGWRPEHQAVSVTRFLTRAASRGVGLMLATAGQLLYLAQATFGLFLIGPLYVSLMIRKHGIRHLLERYERHAVLTVAFVIVTSGGLLFASIMAMASGAKRADHFIYGRYNEPFLALYIAFGLLVLSSAWYKTTRTTLPFWVAAIVGGLTVCVWAARGDALDRNYVGANLFGILALVKALGRIDVIVISVVSLLVFFAVAGLSRRSSVGGMMIVAIGFSLASGYGFVSYSKPSRKGPVIADTLPSRIRQFGVPIAGYDMSGRPRRTPGRFYTYQYLLPTAALKKFNSDRGDAPPSSVVIASKRWRHGERLGARLIAEEPITDHALWVLPDPKLPLSESRSYVNVDLGSRPYTGVWESGFHPAERRRGRVIRWTTGHARLVVPIDPDRRPTKLAVHLVRSPRTTRVVVNGVELLTGPVPQHRRTVNLDGVSFGDRLTIELITEGRPSSQGRRRSRDSRKLGVGVRSIRLVGE